MHSEGSAAPRSPGGTGDEPGRRLRGPPPAPREAARNPAGLRGGAQAEPDARDAPGGTRARPHRSPSSRQAAPLTTTAAAAAPPRRRAHDACAVSRGAGPRGGLPPRPPSSCGFPYPISRDWQRLGSTWISHADVA